MSHTIITTEFQKYLSTSIPGHRNNLDEVIKSYNVHLLKMTTYKKIKVLKSMWAQLPYCRVVVSKSFQIPPYNNQGYRVHNKTSYNIKIPYNLFKK